MLVCSGLSRLVAARRRLSSPNRCGDARAYCCCTRALHRGGVASQMHRSLHGTKTRCCKGSRTNAMGSGRVIPHEPLDSLIYIAAAPRIGAPAACRSPARCRSRLRGRTDGHLAAASARIAMLLAPLVLHVGLAPPVQTRKYATVYKGQLPAASFFDTATVRAAGDRVEGVHCDPEAHPLAARVLDAVPELSSWESWYEHPVALKNGHVHTILPAKLRKVSGNDAMYDCLCCRVFTTAVESSLCASFRPALCATTAT